MKPKQVFKIILDIIMTVLALSQMAYHIEGNSLHEWLGMSLFALFLLHHILNRKWYVGLFKGKYSASRILMVSMNMLLFLAMSGIIISGMMLSREVFRFLGLRAGMFGRRMHMISTAWAYLLMSMHIGLHWGMVIGIAGKHIHLENRSFKTVVRYLPIVLTVYGIYALFRRQLPDRMFRLMEYAFFDYKEPAVFFFADYVCILILFATISYYFSELLKKLKPKRSETK